MFEIGSALREARERQGLELAEVEQQTRIRARFLGALEEERFELLPARAYAKGFLRVYADFLGLDGRLFVEEFNSRFPEEEQRELPPPSARVTLARSLPLRALAALVMLLALALLGVLAWRFGAAQPVPAPPASPATGTRPSPKGAAPSPRPPAKPAARIAHLLLRARGRCWISIRVGSQVGPLLYEGTLDTGAILHYTLAASRPRLWMRIGAPGNLQLSLNGRPAAVLLTGPGDITVDRSGFGST